jgi:branched-chain amino acid transport system substrate-binding protein
VNASGGISGHPLQLTVDDDGGNPGTSVSDLQTLLSAHVDVILDETPLDAAWASNASAASMPVVGGNFSSQPFYTNPDFFPSGQTNDSIAYSVAATAKAAGANSIAQLYCAEAPQCQQSVPLIKASAQKLGVADVYDASIAGTAPNYTAQCVAAQQKHATGLFIGDSPQVIARVGEDCSRQGYNPIYITEGTGFGPPQASAPGLKDKLWQPFPILPYYDNSSPVQMMNSVVDKYYPGLRNSTNWSEYAAQAWTGGLLIGKAVTASGLGASDTPSPAEITQGLTSLKGETLGGWSPALNLTAGRPHPVDCWYTGRVQNGTASMANGGQLTCQTSSS